MVKEQLLALEARQGKLTSVIQEREAFPSRISEGQGLYNLQGRFVEEGADITDDLAIIAKREEKIERVKTHTNNVLRPRLAKVQRAYEGVVTSYAQEYQDEVQIRRVQLTQIRRLAQQGDLSKELLDRRGEEFKELDSRKESDKHLQEGLILLQKKRPATHVSEGSIEFRDEQAKKEETQKKENEIQERKYEDFELTLPNGVSCIVRGKLSADLINMLIEATNTNSPLPRDFLLESVYGEVNSKTITRLRTALLKVRKILRSQYSVVQVIPGKLVKNMQAAYILEEVPLEDSIKEDSVEKIDGGLGFSDEEMTSGVKSTVVYPTSIIEIHDEPSAEERRTAEESAVLSAVVTMLTRHTRIWPNRISTMVNEALAREGAPNRGKRYSNAETMIHKVKLAYEKMSWEAEHSSLLRGWNESDLLLWESIQGTDSVQQIISNLSPDHPARLLWEESRGIDIPKENKQRGLMVRLGIQAQNKFIPKLERIIRTSYGEVDGGE